MLNKIKKITDTEVKKKLLSNFFSLTVLQGANFILPLITFPYLIRVLGAEYFGLLAFALATITYFNIIVDYSFNLTATKDISINRNDKKKLIEIFSVVMTIKFFLLLFSFLILVILVSSFEKFKNDALVYFLTFGIVIGQALFPIWFFQGMEKMKYITYINLSSKIIFTISIFLFVKEESDYYIVPLLTSIGFIISGIYSFYIIKKDFEISYTFQKLEMIKDYFLDGWHIFLQQFYVGLYGPINIIILGFFTNNTIVGYYSIAEKILSIPSSIYGIINQVYYPHAVKTFNSNILTYFNQIKKVSIFYILTAITSTIVLIYFGEIIIELITGSKEINIIIDILTILSLGLVFSAFGQLFTQMFITLSKAKILNTISFRVMVFNLILSPPVIYYFGVIGLAYLVIMRQLIVISTCYILIRRYKRTLLNKIKLTEELV